MVNQQDVGMKLHGALAMGPATQANRVIYISGDKASLHLSNERTSVSLYDEPEALASMLEDAAAEIRQRAEDAAAVAAL